MPWFAFFKPVNSTAVFVKANRSLDFTSDGTFKQYISIPNTAELLTKLDGEYTFSITFRPDAFNTISPYTYHLTKYNGTNRGFAMFSLTTNTSLYCQHIKFGNTANATAVYGSWDTYIGTWVNVTCTKELVSGTTYRMMMYINGSLVATGSSGNFAGDTSKDANICFSADCFGGAASTQASSNVLQVGLWDTAVSGTDIYNEGIDGNWNNVSGSNLVLFPLFNSSTNLEVSNGVKSYHGEYVYTGTGVGTGVSLTNAANLSTLVPP